MKRARALRRSALLPREALREEFAEATRGVAG
jgi:hypothetical protein